MEETVATEEVPLDLLEVLEETPGLVVMEDSLRAEEYLDLMPE
jgi:hypothetical protein